MRVAFFSEVYWPMVSGVSLTLLRTVEALQRRGHAARVYAPAYPLPPATEDRPEVHRSPGSPFFLDPNIQWGAPRLDAVLADLRAFQPDVIHVLTEFAMGRAGVRAARALGVPLIASAHTDYDQYAPHYGMQWLADLGWSYLRRHYRSAATVLVPSEAFAERLRARGILHLGRWTRGVDTREFAPAHRSEAWRASVGCGPEDLLVTCIGRLAPEKGLPTLLAAWQRLAAVRGSARLVLVGSGIMEETLRQQPLPGVTLTGTLRGSALATAYASADLFVLASATETFGNVLLEAMASGLACIAADAGGVTEFARHMENCVLVAPGNAGVLAERMGALLADAAHRRLLGQAARQTAESRSWNAILDELLVTYTSHTVRSTRAA